LTNGTDHHHHHHHHAPTHQHSKILVLSSFFAKQSFESWVVGNRASWLPNQVRKDYPAHWVNSERDSESKHNLIPHGEFLKSLFRALICGKRTGRF
jgi:hypothetical protein